MTRRIYIGVDVGKSGGIAAIDEDGALVGVWKMPAEDARIFDVLKAFTEIGSPRAVLEKVSASPQMGVTSAFSFGGHYRGLRMALVAACIPFDEVRPQIWQRDMDCLTGGDKNVTKRAAQILFPALKVTHAIADALLLAEYARIKGYLTAKQGPHKLPRETRRRGVPAATTPEEE